MKRLTQVQRRLFITLINLRKEKAPSLQDIANVIGDITRQSIYNSLELIEKKGYLYRYKGKFIPTSEGIKQSIADAEVEGRIIKRYVNEYRKNSQKTSRVDDDGSTTESITEPNQDRVGYNT